jgi:TonB family protein
LPPAGSGPVVLNVAPCFEAQGHRTLVPPETYLSYIQLKPSRPLAGVWAPYDEAAEKTMAEDFHRLWDTNLLISLRIDVTDYTFSNGVVGKIVVYNMEERRRPARQVGAIDSSAPANPPSSQFGPEIQFDTKGVEFGPWVRRFMTQVKSNWLIPYAAATVSKGHVVVQFNVHKDGSITDLSIGAPSSNDSFNDAALNALTASNPLPPLPPDYPEEKAFFRVTFFYNESPGQASPAPPK